MQLLYDLLQLPPCSKWNIFKRIKTYFSVRKIKKLIAEDIYKWDSFFENIIDYCTFMEHAGKNFQIPKSENYDCKIIPYNTMITTYILRFNTIYANKDSQVTIIYNTNETDRINVKMKISMQHSELGYDIYLESDKLESYKSDDLKKEIVLFTMEYMKTEIMKTLDAIAIRYIFKRKDKVYEDEKEEVRQD